ncbi:MAG: CPBP family intramembrane metalloprotease [Phycisphaerales bacterium]|nr:MAG: CPBP family intramembrane metalloprotease [Phycisphaerales bacterium]
MSTIRYGTGEVRLVWRLLIIILLFVAVAVLLRFIPICLYTGFLAHNGVAREDALARAKATVFEDPAWSTVIGILNGLMSLPLAWLVVGVIERRPFTWKTVGLDWRRSSLSALACGALLALVLYVLDKVVGLVLGASMPSVNAVLAGLSIPVFIQTFVLYVAMGFGEEVVFRGYVQTRLVERYGIVRGVLVASVTFTLLHIGFRPLPPVTIVSGVVLWAAVGALYHWSRSLYLVGMFHGMANTLMNTFDLEGTDLGGLLLHALVLLLVVVLALRRSAAWRTGSNPT